MKEILYLKIVLNNNIYLVGKLTNENNIKFVFEYLSYSDGDPIDFKRVQYLPLKFRYYEWYGVPEAFDEMIIQPDRPDLPRILQMLKMEKYDPWEYIKRTKGKSETNNWFFESDDSGVKINMLNPEL